MKNKRGFEMAMGTVVVMVIALILLSVGIYIIYSKILKPADTTDSLISCQSRGGTSGSCSGCSGVCLTLPSEPDNKLAPCCIPKS